MSEGSEELDYDWKTPLASAITRGNPEMVTLLLELSADLNCMPDNGDLIEFAREYSTEEIVTILEASRM